MHIWLSFWLSLRDPVWLDSEASGFSLLLGCMTNESSWKGLAKEIVAGGVGGGLGQVVGHPADLVKARLQTSSSMYKGTIDCFLKTAKNEGAHGLFRGLGTPLCGSVLINALLFFSFEGSLRAFRDLRESKKQKPNYLEVALSGCIAGMAQTFIITPIDFIKCNLQVAGIRSNTNVGPVELAKTTLRESGIKGLYRGTLITTIREAPSYGLYFGCYNIVKDYMSPGDSPVSGYVNFISGGIAGVIAWGASYPFDTVKTVIQTLPSDAPRKHFEIMLQMKRIYKEGNLFRGLTTTLIRAWYVNAFIFWGYEQCLLRMNGI
jgi:solute carrier family 25 carnitine/acylcarnitine transporter 20/29